MKKPLIVVAVLVAIVVVVHFFASDHQAFQEFSARRDGWHTRCDAFRQVDLRASAEARACNADLNALMAEARQHGWTK